MQQAQAATAGANASAVEMRRERALEPAMPQAQRSRAASLASDGTPQQRSPAPSVVSEPTMAYRLPSLPEQPAENGVRPDAGDSYKAERGDDWWRAWHNLQVRHTIVMRSSCVSEVMLLCSEHAVTCAPTARLALHSCYDVARVINRALRSLASLCWEYAGCVGGRRRTAAGGVGRSAAGASPGLRVSQRCPFLCAGLRRLLCSALCQEIACLLSIHVWAWLAGISAEIGPSLQYGARSSGLEHQLRSQWQDAPQCSARPISCATIALSALQASLQ